VPKINKKKEKKIEEFFRNGFSGKMGEKWKNGLMGSRWWVEWPENGQWWCCGGGGRDGWRWVGVGLDCREEKDGERGEKGVIRLWKNEGERGRK
jgi:hypothetical protein